MSTFFNPVITFYQIVDYIIIYMVSNGRLILAFDVGTTKLKAGLVDIEKFKVVGKASLDAEIILPRQGWAEVSPNKLWESICKLSKSLISEYNVAPEALIFTAHMAGVLPVGKAGDPLCNIIIWLDERAHGYPRDVWRGVFKIEGYNLLKLIKFLRITGGAPSKTGKDPLSKIMWLRDNEPDIYRSTWKFLDVKGYLLMKSTGNVVTSPDEATLTWLADTRGGRALWSGPLLRDYGLSADLFPEIKESTDLAGRLTEEAASELGVAEDTPVFVGCGDLTAAAVGSGAVSEGEPHIYIGTSDWIGAHISNRVVDVFHYIGSILSGIPGKYLLVAEQEIAAGALEWLMNLGLGGVESYSEVEDQVRHSEPGSGGILFLPWMFGERCPVDNPYLRGAFINLSVEKGSPELYRAVMEGVALNIRWAWKYFKPKIKWSAPIKLVGGAALFDVWCEILSDALSIEIVRMADPGDAGLRGLGAIASVGLGLYKDFEEAAARFSIDKVFKPNPENSSKYDMLFKYYLELYNNLGKKFYPEINS